MHVSKVYEMPVDSYGDVRTLVRGLPYQCPDDWEDVLDSLDEDSNLYLIKEPDNPKDPLAIAAYLDDRRIGYVAASDNAKIWLYLTDEKMPCTFLERFDASFKISFDNPRPLFECMPFEDIYKDKDGVTEEPYADFEIPFLTNPKDKDYDWYDDRTYIMDLEKFIPDFRRKLASRMIILVGRKNSKGEYCYYMPYANNILTDIENDTIKELIDEHGFVIALPDVPMKTEQGGIIMDMHVTYLTGIIFWTFNSMHKSEFVFHLNRDADYRPNTKKKKSTKKSQNVEIHKESSAKKIKDDESYDITDSTDGGKHVSMDVIIPEDGDEDFDFCTYDCHISDKKQIAVITKYMKRYEQGKEPRPFIMIGRPCLGLDNIDIFYSLDGEIIFNFIFDDKIKEWIREAGFVLGKVKDYHLFDPTNSLSLTLSVSKRKSGETLFKQASEEAMDYIEEYCSSQADSDVEARIIDKVEKYMSGSSAMSYKVVIVAQYGIADCKTLDGEDIAVIVDDEIIELAEKNNGVFGYITKVDYDDDGDAWFTIRVSRSIPRLTLDNSTNSSEEASSAINDFFPFWGITLGETTWSQAENMGIPVRKSLLDSDRYISADSFSFWDHEVNGIFTKLSLRNCTNFPQKWKVNGFSWDNSYDEWINIFKSLGYNINITHQPSQEYLDYDTGEVRDYSVLYAEFEALSPDETLLFTMHFNDGEDGDQTSSPSTLSHIFLEYKGEISAPTGVYSLSVDDFFPILGVSLGKTTLKQAEKMGYEIEKCKAGSGAYIDVEDVRFEDDEGNGVFTSLMWIRGDSDFHPLWKSKGFSWDNSYDEWIEIFRKLGYKITVTEQPSHYEKDCFEILRAKFKALSSDGLIDFSLHFDYGKDGYLTSSPKTLDAIFIDFLTSVDMYQDEDDFPPYWKSKGFSWDNSYNEWIDVFRKLNFKITVIEQPKQYEEDDYNVFKAKFQALSSDGMLKFILEFDCGDNGYLTSSPKTLFLANMTYKKGN